MWFSYPREESWIPMPISKVKEIQQQNREGIIPADLGEMVELETKLALKVLDYENVVGQDSLTRLDERRNSNNKKKNKNRGKGPNPNAQPAGPQRPAAVAQVKNVQPRPEGNRPDGNRPDGAKPAGSGNANRRNKHRRPNQNNQNRPDNNRPAE